MKAEKRRKIKKDWQFEGTAVIQKLLIQNIKF